MDTETVEQKVREARLKTHPANTDIDKEDFITKQIEQMSNEQRICVLKFYMAKLKTRREQLCNMINDKEVRLIMTNEGMLDEYLEEKRKIDYHLRECEKTLKLYAEAKRDETWGKWKWHVAWAAVGVSCWIGGLIS